MEKPNLTEALSSVEKLIRQIVGRFCRSTGLTHWEEDLYQESLLVVIQGYPTFDPARGMLTTWAGESVKRRLTHYLHKGRQALREAGPLPNDLTSRDEPKLSEDAEVAVREALILAESRGGKLRKGKRTMFRHLRDLGWTAGRIVASFKELQEVF